ncbi:MAG: zinc ribbon domain-containing protein [Solirubrobacterales bacterium]
MRNPLAILGLSGTLDVIVQLVILGAIVIWLALVWYTYADARRRLEDRLLVRTATAAALIFPLIGTVVYVIVRPPEYLEDRLERELEMEAAAARLASADFRACPHCEEMVASSYLRCPHCMSKLRDPCGSCGRPLDPDWLICPYCEAEIPGVTPSPEEQDRERRRREREAERQAAAGEDPDTVVEEYDEVDYEPEGEYADEEIEEVDIFSEDLPPRADDQDR